MSPIFPTLSILSVRHATPCVRAIAVGAPFVRSDKSRSRRFFSIPLLISRAKPFSHHLRHFPTICAALFVLFALYFVKISTTLVQVADYLLFYGAKFVVSHELSYFD